MIQNEAESVKDLAKDTVEALKKIVGSVEILSQHEMIKQAQESITKKECGKYRLVYKKDTRTIVAEPRRWKWEPKMGEQFIWDEQVWTIGGTKGKWFIVVNTEYGTTTDRLLSSLRKYIPILHWETIERVLEEVGYTVELEGHYSCQIHPPNELRAWPEGGAVAESRQEVVMKAVIELGKEPPCHEK